MKRICFASLAVAAVLATGCNRNHATPGGETAGTSGRVESPASSADQEFVRDVSRANAAEIELSRLAAERSSFPDVKRFAQMMVDDHTAAGAKLAGVATQNSIEAPADLDEAHRSLSEKLSARQGLDFDRDYIDAMIDDHQGLVDKLESRIDRTTLSSYKAESEPATDATPRVDVKAQTVLPEKSDDPVKQRVNAWAAETYPVAYAHLRTAKALKDTLKKRTTN
jgi:putative membrane protein